MKGLDSDAEPIHPHLLPLLHLFFSDIVWICLQGDLYPRVEGGLLLDSFDEDADMMSLHEARSPPSEIDASNLLSLPFFASEPQLPKHGAHHPVYIISLSTEMKITVAALLLAEWDMDVDP
jgi:hypothetical protein